MPIHTNDWNGYLIAITNQKHLLVQQLIQMFIAEFKQAQNTNQIGIQNNFTQPFINVQGQLTTQLKQQSQQILNHWGNI